MNRQSRNKTKFNLIFNLPIDIIKVEARNSLTQISLLFHIVLLMDKLIKIKLSSYKKSIESCTMVWRQNYRRYKYH